MKRNLWMMVAVCGVVVAGTVGEAEAWWPWGRKADKNRDGVVTPREAELQATKDRVADKRRVDTPAEAVVDRNKDGVVGAKEAQVLQNKLYTRRCMFADRPWEKVADRNNDGFVDIIEIRTYHVGQMDQNKDGKIGPVERKAYWAKNRAFVDTAVERRHDHDKNGILSWPEIRDLLRDRAAVVKTDGKAVVNSDIEAEFDLDGDGVLGPKEADAMQDAIEDRPLPPKARP